MSGVVFLDSSGVGAIAVLQVSGLLKLILGYATVEAAVSARE
jgi:hypothetical protein